MQDLIKRALVNEQAMISLLQELEPLVFRISYHLTRQQQDAEDLSQDALYKICRKLSSYRGESSLQTWVYSLVMNSYKDIARKKKNRQTDELSDQLASRPFENDSDLRVLLDSMLHELPEEDRHILILRFQNDLSVREVATIMNLSEANVKIKVFRLKEHLRSKFLRRGEIL